MCDKTWGECKYVWHTLVPFPCVAIDRASCRPRFLLSIARQPGDVFCTEQRRRAKSRGGEDVKPGENGNTSAGEHLQGNRGHGKWDFASAVQYLTLAGVHGAIDHGARLFVPPIPPATLGPRGWPNCTSREEATRHACFSISVRDTQRPRSEQADSAEELYG